VARLKKGHTKGKAKEVKFLSIGGLKWRRRGGKKGGGLKGKAEDGHDRYGCVERGARATKTKKIFLGNGFLERERFSKGGTENLG